MLQHKIGEEKLSKGKAKSIDRNFLLKNPKLRMDIIGGTRAKQRHFDQMFIWYRSLNEQIRSMMKSGTTQQKLLVLMDNYIGSLKTNSNTFVRNANRCYLLAKAISCALFLFKDLNRTSTETHEYLLKMCDLLSFYTFLELKFSSKFSSSKVIIAERISSNYDIHLKDVNIYYTLRVFLCIPTLFNEKEIMSKIFQKYLNRHQHITQTELPDKLYCMYLVAYSKWISLESDYYERIKICETANKNIKPMETLCSNKSYAPFLPVYVHSDSDATKFILSNRINVKLLTKVLKNDACRKENVILIDLSKSDSTNTSVILKDLSWTNILTSDQKSSSVKLESPSIIDTIDLTEEQEQSSSWEVSWLSELLRKSRTSMPPNTLNVFAQKLVGTFEVINIQDDDDDYCAASIETIVLNPPQCEENLKSIDGSKLVDGNNSNIKTGCVEENTLLENNAKEDNLLFSNSVCSSKTIEEINQNCIQDKQENSNLHLDITKKNFQKRLQLPQYTNSMISNSAKNTIKTYEKNKYNDEIRSMHANDSHTVESANNYVLNTLADKKIDTSENLLNIDVDQSNSTTISSTCNNLFRAKSPIVTNTENGDLIAAISTNEEDVDDINSPPVECFSESDADELVQLIDKNTKESNATNLFYNQNKHNSISQIPNSHKVPISNSHMRKVSFATLPEKHVATSSHFSMKNLKNMDKTQIEKECNEATKFSSNNTKISANNLILTTSDLNFNQPKLLCNTSETGSQSSSDQELASSSDRSSLPIAELNRQNKISGTIGSLFMMKFPQPTYQKLANFDISTKKKPNIITHACEDLRTDLDNAKNYSLIKKNNNKNYSSDKKYKSDFDRYLEKLKEKRSKTSQKPKNWFPKKAPQSLIDTSVQKGNNRKISNLYDVQKHAPQSQINTSVQKRKNKKISILYDVQKHVDEKLQKKPYVKIERLNFSQYVTSKLETCLAQKAERANQLSTLANPYVRIKRIKNIKENIIKDLEANIHQNILLVPQCSTSKLYLSSKNISEINSTCNNFHNTVRQNSTATEIKPNKKIDKILPSQTTKKFCMQVEKNEKIVTSQSESPTMYQNSLDRLNGYDKNDCNLKDLENEVTSTQDHVDILEEYKISSTQDILNKEVCNSVQNNEIDTSQQVLVRRRGKRKSTIDSRNSLLSKTNLLYDIEPNFFTHDFDKGSFNNEANLPTTTTISTSTIKGDSRKKQMIVRRNSRVQRKQISISNDFIHTKNNESPSLATKLYSVFGDYQTENLSIAKTYSKHNLVSNVFVPPEVEKNFDVLN